MQGRIKHANSRGFGFIETEKGIDFYFHYTEFKGNWKQMLQKFVSNEVITVEFENDSTAPDGPRAKNVSIVEIGEKK